MFAVRIMMANYVWTCCMENVNAANARHRKKYDDAKNTEWHRQRAIHNIRKSCNAQPKNVSVNWVSRTPPH